MPRIDLRELELLSDDSEEEIVDRRDQKRSKEFKRIKKDNIYYDEE